jgi:hypothetical protein
MSTTGGRQTIRFSIPDYSAKYAEYPTDTADLIFRYGIWWWHVVMTIPAPEIEPTDQVFGVDLGIVRPAISQPNTMQVLLDVMLVGCLPTNQSCPIPRRVPSGCRSC